VLVLPFVAACQKTAPIRVAAAGDVQLGDGLTLDPFADLRPLLDGDVRFANLEGPFARDFAGADKELFAFDPARAAWLRARLDVVSLENNHALDRGPSGRDFTVAELERAGIAAAYRGHDAALRLAGRRVALLARAYAPEADLDAAAPELVAAVMRARRQGLVLVSLHWGHSGLYLPTPAQRQLAARLVAAGASAVLGHGPHTAMGVERVGKSVIAYSLGNLAFGCDCTDVSDAFTLGFSLAGDGNVDDVVLRPLRAGLMRPVAAAHDPDLAQLYVELAHDLDTHASSDGELVRLR
jgi:poly-gamma-glutamate synthesis protein (capsule biosynthesis protein)